MTTIAHTTLLKQPQVSNASPFAAFNLRQASRSTQVVVEGSYNFSDLKLGADNGWLQDARDHVAASATALKTDKNFDNDAFIPSIENDVAQPLADVAKALEAPKGSAETTEDLKYQLNDALASMNLIADSLSPRGTVVVHNSQSEQQGRSPIL